MQVSFEQWFRGLESVQGVWDPRWFRGFKVWTGFSEGLRVLEVGSGFWSFGVISGVKGLDSLQSRACWQGDCSIVCKKV
jgi:hypothetical protein